MISKEKKMILILCLITLILILIYISSKSEKKAYAYDDNIEELAEIKYDQNAVIISNAKQVDLDKIIQNNSKETGYREEITVEEVELEYITKAHIELLHIQDT